ncbi:hypothetical protein CLU79DRAFT_728783 [Phycomyces nitens]|nr:hypothetical protein CLU79DRAFT_728783 [Phycomyces nitens]
MSSHTYLVPYEKVSPLLIPEIAGLICDVVDPRDLLSLVLTCKVFYDAASVRLWRTLHPRSLLSLLKVKSTLEGKHRVKNLSCNYHQLIQTFRWSSRDDPTCRTFELEFFEHFSFPNLVQLEFSYMAAQSQTLCKMIAASPHLRYIDLSHCYCLSTQAILPLFLMPHHHLQTLILYGCGQMDPNTLATLIMHHHQSLQCVRLTDISDRVLEAIQHCVVLKDLGLEHCTETKLSADALLRFSRPTKTWTGLGLVRLRLRDIANLTSDHIRGIVDSSQYTLVHLDISECNRLSRDGFNHIASQCILLETLMLAYQAGVEDQAIQVRPTLSLLIWVAYVQYTF